MAFRVVLKEPIIGYLDFTVDALEITDGFLVAGLYRTPLSNIEYIVEVT